MDQVQEVNKEIQKFANSGQTMTANFVRARLPAHLQCTSISEFTKFLAENFYRCGLDRFTGGSSGTKPIFRALSTSPHIENQLVLHVLDLFKRDSSPVLEPTTLKERNPEFGRLLTQRFQGNCAFFLIAHSELQPWTISCLENAGIPLLRLVHWLPQPVDIERFSFLFSESASFQSASRNPATTASLLESALERWPLGEQIFKVQNHQISLRESFESSYIKIATFSEPLSLMNIAVRVPTQTEITTTTTTTTTTPQVEAANDASMRSALITLCGRLASQQHEKLPELVAHMMKKFGLSGASVQRLMSDLSDVLHIENDQIGLKQVSIDRVAPLVLRLVSLAAPFPHEILGQIFRFTPGWRVQYETVVSPLLQTNPKKQLTLQHSLQQSLAIVGGSGGAVGTARVAAVIQRPAATTVKEVKPIVSDPAADLLPSETTKPVATAAVSKNQTENFPAGIKVVNTLDQALDAVQSLSKSKVSSVAIDCEGIELGAQGQLCLVQLTAPSFPVFIFSVLECPQILNVLKTLLESPKIIKVLHDSRQDSAALAARGINMNPIEDTQRMFDLLQELTGRVENGGVASYASATTTLKTLGLNRLLHIYRLPQNPHKEDMKNRHDVWSSPISQADPMTVEYAAWDVRDLLELRKRLQADLSRCILDISSKASLEYSKSRFGSDSSLPNNSLEALMPPPVGRDGFSSGKTFVLTFNPHNGQAIRTLLQDSVDIDQSKSVSSSEAGSKSSHNAAVSKEVESVLSLLPEIYQKEIRTYIEQNDTGDQLVEFYVDVGRTPTAVCRSGKKIRLDSEMPPETLDAFLKILYQFKISESRNLDAQLLLKDDEGGVGEEIGAKLETFLSSDNRMGIRGSLHRISCKKDRKGKIDGLTYRIGRHAPGCTKIIQDTVAQLAAPADDDTAEKKSLLIMGKPGTGKTTLLREISSTLAGVFDQSVMIVDSSNEIGGDSEVPHEAIGYARRMEVPERSKQHLQMIEAVQNHSPGAIVIDEIGSSQEVHAAQTIAQRGVSLIGTAHGGSLAAAMRNTVLRPLLGGVETVILSAQEAAKDDSKQKGKLRTVRKEPPTFSHLIEILRPGYFRIYHNLAEAIDNYLAGTSILVEERWLDGQSMFGKFARVSPGALKGESDLVKAAGEAVAEVLKP